MLNADVRTFHFTSDHDGLVISAVAAIPSGQVNGVVQIVHGMNEHKERYYDFMDYLASEGFITVIHDNRGHGKSLMNEDDLGFMYKDGGEGFISDIAQVCSITKQRLPAMPYFLIGHSMGSLGARCFLKEHDAEINGLIVLGCPCYSSLSGFVRSVDSAASKSLGQKFRSEKIREIAENTLNKKFAKNGEDNLHSWICSKKEVVEEFNADPLCNFVYTLNGYEALLWLMRECYSKKGWNVTNHRLPIRFISGKDDPCMLSEKKFFKAMEQLEKLGYGSISHRLFDNMRHEVLNEKHNINVYKDIAKTLFSWIDRYNEEHHDQPAIPQPVSVKYEEPAPVPEPELPPEKKPEDDVFDVLETVKADGTAEIEKPADIPAPDKKEVPEFPEDTDMFDILGAVLEDGTAGIIGASDDTPAKPEIPEDADVFDVLEAVRSDEAMDKPAIDPSAVDPADAEVLNILENSLPEDTPAAEIQEITVNVDNTGKLGIANIIDAAEPAEKEKTAEEQVMEILREAEKMNNQ